MDNQTTGKTSNKVKAICFFAIAICMLGAIFAFTHVARANADGGGESAVFPCGSAQIVQSPQAGKASFSYITMDSSYYSFGDNFSFQGVVIANSVCNTNFVDGVAVNVNGKSFKDYNEIEQFINQNHEDSKIAIGRDVYTDKITFVVDADKITNDIIGQFYGESVTPNQEDTKILPLGGKFDNCNKDSDFRWDTLAGNQCLLLYDRGSNYTPSNGVEWTNMTTMHAIHLNAIIYFEASDGGHRYELKAGESAYPSEPAQGSRVDLY